MDTEQTGLSLEQALGVLRRRAPSILLCFVLATGVAYGFSKHQTKQYTATASLVFTNSQLGQQVAGLQPTEISNQQAQQNTNVKLVQSGDIAAKTAGRLGKGFTEEEISGALSVSAPAESNIIDVSATTSSPALSAKIANTYTKQFVEEQQNSNHAYYASALVLVNKQLAAMSQRERAGTAGLALQDRAQSLGVLAELRSGNVQVAQIAKVPKSPSSPDTWRNTVLGAVLGLVLGLCIALLLERFDRRIRDPRDLERIYDLPLLGAIPESAALSSAGNARAALPPRDEEAFHMIRAHLRYFNVDRDMRTLLVASAAPGDGKTTISRHLAAAAARHGSRVLLLEADLRRPTLARQLDVQLGPGLADVLIGSVSLSNATQPIALESPSGEGSRGSTLEVLVAGAALPPNPGKLIESHAMESLLAQAKSTYDLVVIDTSPLGAISDAFALLGKVDGVVIVSRVGRNRRDEAQRLHETLAGARAPSLGVIANGCKSRGSGIYGYSYDYVQETQSAAPAVGVSLNGSGSSEQPVPRAAG
jgi:succinoglycan biosynthesis transport protein ExoP